MKDNIAAPVGRGDDAERLERNIRVQKRYDELRALGRHGHYETLFRVVREEEVERAISATKGER